MTGVVRGLRKVWTRSVGLARFAREIRPFLAETLTSDEAARIIRLGVEARNARFLHKLKDAVYARSESPYRRLLLHAGCCFQDVEELVRREGLEDALGKLAAAGVFLTFDEFKCRTPIVRGSQTVEARPSDFDDVTIPASFVGATSGGSGKPTPVRWSFAATAQSAPHWCVFFAANDCLGQPLLYWRPGHAGASGAPVAWAKFGQRIQSWFHSQEMTNPWDRLYAEAVRWVGRRFADFPCPRKVAYDNPGPILDEVERHLATSSAASLNTTPSAAVHLSLEARSRDVSLQGLTCLLGAEALTPARRIEIEASGARAVPLYGSQEATWVGGQCPHPQHPDEVHVLRDLHAVIAAPDSTAHEPSPLLFTSLAPVTPKVLLNTDIGDSGVIGHRRCDCLYGQIGCHQTLHTVRSSDKITGFGVTFWVADICDVLETALPRRCGGRTGDYQLLEYEAEDSLPRYLLVMNPNLPETQPGRLVETFLAELSARKSYYGFMAAIWRHERAVKVQRRQLSPTSAGKVALFRRIARLDARVSQSIR